MRKSEKHRVQNDTVMDADRLVKYSETNKQSWERDRSPLLATELTANARFDALT